MWGDVSLDDHIMLTHTTPTPTTTTTGTNVNTTNNPTNTPTATPNTSHNPASNTSTSTRTPPANTLNPDPEETVRPGDCVEVWWDDTRQWYPCVIVDSAEDFDGSLVSLCKYDDEVHGRWHNFQVVYTT